MTRDPILEIVDLDVCYGPTQVLFGISLAVAPGSFATFLGRNGMGKSTLVKSVMGMARAKSGTIRLAEREISNLPIYEISRAGVGLVPEGRRIFPTLTVHENLIAFAANPRGIPSSWTPEKVYSVFPSLQKRSRALGRTLSGGEQQMLAIGRALVTSPRLLILDEVTEGLAPIVSEQIWASLALLKSEGLSIIAIDKNLSPLLSLADQHFIIEKGKVVWSGTSSEFRASQEQLQRYLSL
jgi:branched-chain amino acid transport system ATP-binding protein